MTSAFLLVITLAIKPILLLFFAAESPAIPVAIHMNYLVGWSYIVMGVSMVAVSVVRGNGAVLVPLIFLIISMIIVRLGIGFGFHDQHGAEAIWWAFGISSIFSASLSMGYFLHGGWRKLKPL
jgi:Na+-driven multidrug efflux pump